MRCNKGNEKQTDSLYKHCSDNSVAVALHKDGGR